MRVRGSRATLDKNKEIVYHSGMKFMQKTASLIVPILFLLVAPETFASAPTVSTDPVSSVSQNSATLNGTLINTGGLPITSAGFNYGLTTNYGNNASANISFGSTDFAILYQNINLGESNLAPKRMTMDADGNIYVADPFTSTIKKFNSSGSLVLEFGSHGLGQGQFMYPNGVIVDQNGNIYVSDFSNHGIQKFNSSGVFLSEFGSAGSAGNGQFSAPSKMTLDSSGNIYVADQNNHLIQKFNSSGVFLSQFGGYGSDNGQFFQPVDMKVDSSGNIYVVDYGNHRIQKFNSAGVYLSQFGSLGFGDGQFASPRAIDIDASGFIYVADGGNMRIQKFNSAGVYQSKITFDQFTPPASPQDIVVSPTGDIYTINIGGYNNYSSIVKKLRPDIDPKQVNSLLCGKTYHYRVFATNADGTSYGNDMTFQTSNCFPYLPPNREPVTSKPTLRPITLKSETKQTEVVEIAVINESKIETQTATVIDSVESRKPETSKEEKVITKE